MTCDQERKIILKHVSIAKRSGASWQAIDDTIGMSSRTLIRWRNDDTGDDRPDAVHPIPAHALTQEEQQEMVDTANKPEFRSLPPAQFVTIMNDNGEYIASESSFYRVLKKCKMLKHRGKARAPQKKIKTQELIAKANGEVWTWDITWLPSDINGQFYKLYMIMDLFNRMIVGWEVFNEENSENSQQVLHKATLSQGYSPDYLHGDNGKPVKNANLHAMMIKQEIQPTHSRPRVSNDNAHAEALFRTVKYHPTLPDSPFKSLEEAQQWVMEFVSWYNNEHRHKGIGMVTPAQKHAGEDVAILQKRKEVIEAAKAKNPKRWNGRNTRKCDVVTQTKLNHVTMKKIEKELKKVA
jgi:putative transposase